MTTAAFDPRIGDIARTEHRHLLDIAFRMLGDLGRAEDMVQEAFIRLARSNLDSIQDARGWLVVVVGRLCLDHLRSASARHEAAIDQSSLEIATVASALANDDADPADRVTLDETVRAALLAVLERLTPPERTAFVLHDVFQLPFQTVGSIVGRTPTACRQLASRARQRLRSESAPIRSHIEPPEHRVVVERFMAAAAGGDLGALMQVLDPNVTAEGTRGGVITAASAPSHGPQAVGRRLISYVGPQSATALVSSFVNDQPAVLVTRDGYIAVVLLLKIRDGLIEHVHAVGDPIGLSKASNY
ncbi:MAG TPA: sigma-70 family RNA polymerase sigma factor [Jatrophihabitantaceae bacterium]|nr:sigma-70 family RNA polymerase sigma factor [Jatrophihabitantaceae bacterium]